MLGNNSSMILSNLPVSLLVLVSFFTNSSGILIPKTSFSKNVC